MVPKLTDPIGHHPNAYMVPMPANIRSDGTPTTYIWPIPAQFAFIEAWESGLSHAQMTERFGVSGRSASRMMCALGLAHKRTQRQFMTGRRVAEVLGRPQTSVAGWIRRGIIRHHKQRCWSGKSGYVTAVTPADLRAFLADHQQWFRVDLEQITDPYWRSIAIELRG